MESKHVCPTVSDPSSWVSAPSVCWNISSVLQIPRDQIRILGRGLEAKVYSVHTSALNNVIPDGACVYEPQFEQILSKHAFIALREFYSRPDLDIHTVLDPNEPMRLQILCRSVTREPFQFCDNIMPLLAWWRCNQQLPRLLVSQYAEKDAMYQYSVMPLGLQSLAGWIHSCIPIGKYEPWMGRMSFWDQLRAFTLETLVALGAIHSGVTRVCHRDIHSGNVVIANSVAKGAEEQRLFVFAAPSSVDESIGIMCPASEVTAYLSDFGFAQLAPPREKRIAPIDEVTDLNMFLDDVRYQIYDATITAAKAGHKITEDYAHEMELMTSFLLDLGAWKDKITLDLPRIGLDPTAFLQAFGRRDSRDPRIMSLYQRFRYCTDETLLLYLRRSSELQDSMQDESVYVFDAIWAPDQIPLPTEVEATPSVVVRHKKLPSHKRVTRLALIASTESEDEDAIPTQIDFADEVAETFEYRRKKRAKLESNIAAGVDVDESKYDEMYDIFGNPINAQPVVVHESADIDPLDALLMALTPVETQTTNQPVQNASPPFGTLPPLPPSLL